MSPAPRSLKPLWACPRCGRSFTARNQFHSCERHSLAEHFTGKEPVARALYNQFTALVHSFGPVTIYAQKSRIVFQGRIRFAGVVVRRRWLEVTLWLKRRAQHPLFHRVEVGTLGNFGHIFRLKHAGDLDADLQALVREAYDVGQGVHPTSLRC